MSFYYVNDRFSFYLLYGCKLMIWQINIFNFNQWYKIAYYFQLFYFLFPCTWYRNNKKSTVLWSQYTCFSFLRLVPWLLGKLKSTGSSDELKVLILKVLHTALERDREHGGLHKFIHVSCEALPTKRTGCLLIKVQLAFLDVTLVIQLAFSMVTLAIHLVFFWVTLAIHLVFSGVVFLWPFN